MNQSDIASFKTRLEQERATLEIELADIGYLHPEKTDDWAERQADLADDTEDRNILADKFEENTTNEGIARELLVRHQSINHALERIASGSFGLCTTCKKPISQARLEVNPAADTCVEHAR